jgi:glycosyltransferase involved in cell wall biosynthesis
MKIVICWTNIAGYTAACWRALAARPGVDLHVICFRPADNSRHTHFQESLLQGISHRFLTPDEIAQPRLVAGLVAAEKPEAILVSGWAYRCFFELPYEPALSNARCILAMDTAWRGDLRQRIGKVFLSKHVRRMAAVLVAGENARQYALRLGAPESRIHRGLYAYDQDTFNEDVFQRRIRGGREWPRRFLFVGRYAHEKSIDVLIEAYEAYRRQAAAPWLLNCCGIGELKGLVCGVDGVTDLGFIQPREQADVFADHGVLVLPSRYEPWGVVVAEAMATGMPVICSSACGAGAELMRPYTTGIEIPAGDRQALADAFAWMDAHRDRLPSLGRTAMQTARPYGSDHWAERFDSICRSL